MAMMLPPALRIASSVGFSPALRMARYSVGFSPALRMVRGSAAWSPASAGPARAPTASAPASAATRARRTPGMRDVRLDIAADLLVVFGWAPVAPLTPESFPAARRRAQGGAPPDRAGWPTARRRSADTAATYTRRRVEVAPSILERLYPESPYAGFPLSEWPPDVDG